MTKEELKAKLLEQGRTEAEFSKDGKELTKAELEELLQKEGDDPRSETYADRQTREAAELQKLKDTLVNDHGYTYEALQGRTQDDLNNMIRNKTVDYHGQGFADLERVLEEKGQQLGREDDAGLLAALRGAATDTQIAEFLLSKYRNTQREQKFTIPAPPEKGETK